jgi:hypothetical protein
MDQPDTSGFTVAYARDEAPFPVYAAATIAAILLTTGTYTLNPFLIALGLVAAGFAYYNLPLVETGRPRMGGNQYGIFIEGFGIIHWRAIDRIEMVQIAFRSITIHELQITLKQPLDRALIADWRKQPLYRQLMRVPWSMSYKNMVRVKLDAFDKDPGEIERTFLRMWRHYRS